MSKRTSATNKPPLSLPEAKARAAKYCAYQERTQQQVRDKLYSLGLHQENVEILLSELITEGYINEVRFACQYAGGKFRLKKWGRIKIEQGLKGKGLTSYCIEKGLQEIDEADYYETLKILALKKYETTMEENVLMKRLKVSNYLKSRGYEYDLIMRALDEC